MAEPDVDDCVDELRGALAAHGITLPSLGVDLVSYAGDRTPPLVTLGHCNLPTTRALTRVLREAAPR